MTTGLAARKSIRSADNPARPVSGVRATEWIALMPAAGNTEQSCRRNGQLSGLAVARLARFSGGDNPAFEQGLEPFLPAEQSRGLTRPDLARSGNCHRD